MVSGVLLAGTREYNFYLDNKFSTFSVL